MREPIYISNDSDKNEGLDYDFLRQEGIRIVQKLTGAFWTDYNAHDPGVTILEQLCYALTEISYRSEFDIKDILYSEAESDQSFFKPDEILPSNAVTINDYRKLLFDSVLEITNVWLFPVTSQKSKMQGLYSVLIDIDSEYQEEKQREAIVKKVRNAFNDHRNLCEDIHEINILKYLYLDLEADIELTGDVSSEKVMAQLHYRVNEYLCPEIKFYSLEELLQQGYKLNEVFNGPLLKHGFVKTEELPSKTDKVLISEVMKIIMQIPGVASVKNLKLISNGVAHENQIALGDNEIPKLNRFDESSHKDGHISFTKGDIQYKSLNYEEVRRIINEMRSENRRVYRLNGETIDIPKGKELDLKKYFSVQNHFPAIYGIGPQGIPNAPTEKRKAQARQLKGYLMLFEQVIANALMQLHHSKDLLSIGGNRNRSYYYQPLDAVPNVEPLYNNSGKSEVDLLSPSNESIPLNYKEGLATIVQMGESNDRDQRLIDYLLAMHGEEFSNLLGQFNYYFSEEEFEQFIKKNKSYFLQFLPFINKNKFRGFNYLKDIEEEGNVSGVEAKLSVLLGLSSFEFSEVENRLLYRKKSLLKDFATHEFEVIDSLENGEFEQNLQTIKQEVIDENFEIIDDEDVVLEDFTQQEKDKIMERSLFLKERKVDLRCLHKGLAVENFRIGKKSDTIKSVSVAFQLEDDADWIELAKYSTETDAELAVMLHIELFKQLNIGSEGIHLVEHVLLRPHADESKFGLFLADQKGKPVLGSTKTFTFEERLELEKNLEQHLRQRDNYSVEINEDRDFEIHFTIKDKDLTFVGLEANISVEEAHRELEELVSFMRDEHIKVPLADKISYFVQNNPSSPKIPEEFLSQRMSVFLPDWTARFDDKEFRSMAEEIVYEHQPANVSIKINWLGYEEMKKFEELYFDWCAGKSKQKPEPKVVDELSNFLFDHYHVATE